MLPSAVLERALCITRDLPSASLFIDVDRVHLGIDLADTLRFSDPHTALAAFASHASPDALFHHGTQPHSFGWLAYDALRHDDPTAVSDPRPRGDHAPLAYLARYASVLTVHADGTTRAWHHRGRATGSLDALWHDSAGRTLAPRTNVSLASATSRERHRASVESIRESIRDGEVYLVNLARFVHSPVRLDREQLARRLLDARPARGGLLGDAHVALAGASMELALHWDRASGTLTTQPIKGTRPRGGSPDEDRERGDDLLADPKERAENVMAVDVHRNDLGRIAVPGSVAVPSLCALESHAYVHHLVSTVTARVDPVASTIDVLRAMLPVGSVTGAPKRSAMITAAQLEPERRGVYTGVYGTVACDGSLTLAVAIRTIVCDEAGSHYGVGGGIVIDSDPDREWAELQWKQRALGPA